MEPEWFNATSSGTIADFVFDDISISGAPPNDSKILPIVNRSAQRANATEPLFPCVICHRAACCLY